MGKPSVLGVHEPTVLKFDKLIKENDDFSLMLKYKSGKNLASIIKTEYQDVYKMNILNRDSSYYEYVAPRSKLKTFKTIVNYTPNGKQGELFNW